MKLQYLSDLHLEFKDNVEHLRHFPLRVAGDVLVVAGDCFYLDDVGDAGRTFLKWAADNYERVMLVPGNHEYYGGYDVRTLGDAWEMKLATNVGVYHNKVVSLGDLDVILSTLWSRIAPEHRQAVSIFLNDFHRAKYDGRAFTPEDYNAEHERSLAFIKRAVAESRARRRVVVTHHVPSHLCTPRKLRVIRDGTLEDAFTVDLPDYIREAPIDYWIYGHSHVNVDVAVGGTLVTANQLGYVFRGENEWNCFDRDKHIEI